jgi:hypothetical protein
MLASVLFTAPAVHAGPIVTPIEIYSTGEPASQGTQTVDTHWSLISSPGVYPDIGSALYVVNTVGFPFNGAWVADYGTAARWIAPQPTYSNYRSDVAGSYVYGTSFVIDQPDADPTTAMLWGEVSSDNCTTDIIINGQSTGFNMKAMNPGAQCTKTHYYFELGGSNAVFTAADGSVFTTHVDFLAGLNTIQFKVSNYECSTGCLQNPTGIIVKIQGNVDSPGDPEPTPEPATTGLMGLALTALGFAGRHWHRSA